MGKCRETLFLNKWIAILCAGIILIAFIFLMPFYSMAEEGETTETTETTETVQIGAPNSFSVTQDYINSYAGQTDITMKWSNPTGITWVSGYSEHKYRVQIATDSSWNNIVEDYETWYDSDEISLDMGYTYYFRVQAICYIAYYNDEAEWISYTVEGDWSETATIKALYDAPTVTSAASSGATSITLTWNNVEDVDDEVYHIYRATSYDGVYSEIGTVTNGYYNDEDDYIYLTSLTYTDNNLTTGMEYFYKIALTNGEASSVKSATPIPAKLKLTAEAASYKSIALSWEQGEAGVSGYILYMSESQTGSYKVINTVTSVSALEYTKKGLTTGKKYYFKIVAYSDVNGQRIYGTESDIVQGVPSVVAPTIKAVKVTAVTKATISWKKVSGASGYIVYKATTKNGKYKKVATIKSKKKTSYTVSGLKNGKKYYFKVQAYRTINGKKYKGVMSDASKVIMNKLGYEGEGYTKKCKRIFGKKYYKKYASEAVAKKNMVTISIKVWDINSSNHKYTRTMYLTVNKNIASTVRQIFREIYKGKERFPIHSIGGYRWCGSSSSSEHNEGLAIDINPDENAQFDSNGTVLVGNCYEPGENPYSITADGDVVKAFYKYGFGWGYWYSRPDYMHFSYFGT